MKNKNYITAKQFFDNLQQKYKENLKEINTFKLVNGLFIVKYFQEDLCEFVTNFHKAGSVLGLKKTNTIDKIGISPPNFKQIFNPKKAISCNTLGFWKPLNIGWKEQPIEEILN